MWNPGTVGELLAAEQYKGGFTGSHLMQAVIRAARDNQGAQDQPNPAKSSVSNANGTAQTLRASAGRLYHARIVNTDDDAVNVVFSDGGNTIIVGGGVCPAQIAASGSIPAIPGVCEVAWTAGRHGNGQLITTDLRVRAFKLSDGTTGSDNGVTVTALTSGS